MTREEAVKLLSDVANDYFTSDAEADALNLAIKALEQEQRWIPCTPDTMPEVENNIGARVLITASWGLVREAYYCIDHWEIDDIPYKLTSVIAWMPLPEPYGGEQE